LFPTLRTIRERVFGIKKAPTDDAVFVFDIHLLRPL
jgi:hypothetical protein